VCKLWSHNRLSCKEFHQLQSNLNRSLKELRVKRHQSYQRRNKFTFHSNKWYMQHYRNKHRSKHRSIGHYRNMHRNSRKRLGQRSKGKSSKLPVTNHRSLLGIQEYRRLCRNRSKPQGSSCLWLFKCRHQRVQHTSLSHRLRC